MISHQFLKIYLINNAVDEEVKFLLDSFLGIAVLGITSSLKTHQSVISVSFLAAASKESFLKEEKWPSFLL